MTKLDNLEDGRDRLVRTFSPTQAPEDFLSFLGLLMVGLIALAVIGFIGGVIICTATVILASMFGQTFDPFADPTLFPTACVTSLFFFFCIYFWSDRKADPTYE